MRFRLSVRVELRFALVTDCESRASPAPAAPSAAVCVNAVKVVGVPVVTWPKTSELGMLFAGELASVSAAVADAK